MTEIPHKHRLYGQKEFSPFIGRFTIPVARKNIEDILERIAAYWNSEK